MDGTQKKKKSKEEEIYMRYIKQFAIIIAISFLGEAMNRVIPLPIPASIYGLLLMFLALFFKIFPVSAVKETSSFLLEVMPLMFIPPSVAIIDNLALLQGSWWKLVILAFVSTLGVMVVSGAVTQCIITKSNKGKKGKERK